MTATVFKIFYKEKRKSKVKSTNSLLEIEEISAKHPSSILYVRRDCTFGLKVEKCQ